MFVTATLKDNVAVTPSQFSAPPQEAITNELNKKYANRVLLDVGLCICVFDLIWVGEGLVKYGDGCYWYKVTFRMVVFRPSRSQVIFGKIKSSTEESIRVTLGFFDDIYIPQEYLPIASVFDLNEQAFFWIPVDAESPIPTPSQLLDTDVSNRRYLDRGDIIRLRVERDEFYDNEPGPRKGESILEERAEDDVDRKAPYTIIASIQQLGLGPFSWWEGSEETMEASASVYPVCESF
ncbi:DNA-directed RNA polymerase III subunit C25 [Ceratobasidium sp. AG-Ba]|nr:DNA-directed RNA polymerase III subunit C25 [Ceratobasidium sp. AG-Ba]